MKFWQKTFFVCLVLVLIATDCMGYLLYRNSYTATYDATMRAAEIEIDAFSDIVHSTLANAEGNFTHWNADNLQMLLSYRTYYAKNREIYMQIRQGDSILYSTLPDGLQLDNNQTDSAPTLFTIGDHQYYQQKKDVSLQHSVLQAVYLQNMDWLLELKQELIQTFFFISVTVSVLLAVVLLFLVLWLTKPLRDLADTTERISQGDYTQRAQAHTRDEIGDFAQSFNRMADHVEQHMLALSREVESKQRFIDNLSHEIRTPTTAIVGYAELLQYANCAAEDWKNAVAHIAHAGNRVLALSHTLLKVSALQAQNSRLVPLSLSERLQAACALVQIQCEKAEITLALDIKPDIVILGDSVLLESLVVNLLENAMTACVAGDAITLSADAVPAPHFCISDTGCGMDAETVSHIAEPFYRGDAARSGGQHLGLGFSLCQQICERHNATLHVVSAQGEGTKVSVTFCNFETTL